MNDKQLLDAAKRSGLSGKKVKMIIEKCSGDYFYKSMIGQEVKIAWYGSFGCFDNKGRWYNFYDLKRAE